MKGRKEGRKEGRKGGRKEGRKERRKEGRKGGREGTKGEKEEKEERTFIFSSLLFLTLERSHHGTYSKKGLMHYWFIICHQGRVSLHMWPTKLLTSGKLG